MCFKYLFAFMFVWRWFEVAKIRLYVHSRKQGSYIASVPLKHLIELSECRKKRWEFKDGWLILEGFWYLFWVCFFGEMGFLWVAENSIVACLFSRTCALWVCARAWSIPWSGLYHGISFQNLNDFGSLEGGGVYVYVDFFSGKNHFAGYFPSVVLLLLL
jgi:hypothetical protein